jgi:hypothetical protein
MWVDLPDEVMTALKALVSRFETEGETEPPGPGKAEDDATMQALVRAIVAEELQKARQGASEPSEPSETAVSSGKEDDAEEGM